MRRHGTRVAWWQNRRKPRETTVLGRRGTAIPAVPLSAGHVLRAMGVGKKIDEAVLLLPTDVNVGPGECVVLRGPNGSGKTTMLRILAGTLPPSEGEATPVSYTHLRAHETDSYLVCRLLLEKKKKNRKT